MNVTKDGIKDRQLHIEGYLQMVSAEQKEYAEVSAHQRITENNDIITDFQTDNLMEQILQNNHKKLAVYIERLKGVSPLDKLNQGFSHVADETGRTVNSVYKVKKGDSLLVHVKNGTIKATVDGIMEANPAKGD